MKTEPENLGLGVLTGRWGECRAGAQPGVWARLGVPETSSGTSWRGTLVAGSVNFLPLVPPPRQTHMYKHVK